MKLKQWEQMLYYLLLPAYLLNRYRNSTELAHSLNLEVLLEIHTEEELKHFNSDIDLVGINNRNLKDFKVDLQHSVNLKIFFQQEHYPLQKAEFTILKTFIF